MNVKLISFQEKAVRELRLDVADALESYRRRKKTQVISLQAPTGAGKTIIAAALIEDIYCGSTLGDGTIFAEQPEAIFVWLSDSPELNEQSKEKIELKTSKLRYGQCVTISEHSFDKEILDDGYIYFLNTQKISKNGKLTRHGDFRQYTIWETLENTIRNKSDHLYFIIDEAHRGAKSKREAGTDTTIMQRFLRGFESVENGVRFRMHSMPIVLGISATADRFNTLVGSIDIGSLQKCIIYPDDVRSSGLLKDRIVITYPEDPAKNNDFVLLEAAVDEWMQKCKRWYQYTYEQHYANVDPVLIVQVRQGGKGSISDTDIKDVLNKIEERVGSRFKEGEIVHCFGEGTAIEWKDLKIQHIRASEIASNHKVKVVLFKEALSTGWDCPRAETMMSFAVRSDPTYIAQLLGRMIRTPLQMRVARDEFLNDVKLYLPRFNRDTVEIVVEELLSNEGGDIPTEINGESLEEPESLVWTSHIPKRPIADVPESDRMTPSPNGILFPGVANLAETIPPSNCPIPSQTPEWSASDKAQHTEEAQIDREGVIDFINAQGYLTYVVRRERINDYLKSLLDLVSLLTLNGIDPDARNSVINDVVSMICHYIESLHRTGEYDALAETVMEFKLSSRAFDPFGIALPGYSATDLTVMSETDLDRQLRIADVRLGRFGFLTVYGQKNYKEEDPNAYKIDYILFAANDACRAELNEYAKKKFHELARRHRLKIVNKSDSCKKRYHDIMADADIVSEQLFTIPETVVTRVDPAGIEYKNHLLASPENGVAKIKLNDWEAPLIEQESKRPDFVCWLRNPARAPWALCIPYEMNGETKGFFPDFLIIRRDPTFGYVVDLLEPHGEQYADNLPKAKGLAKYAKTEDRFGKIQLIRKENENFVRLDLTDREIRNKILHATDHDELNHIFDTDGIVD